MNYQIRFEENVDSVQQEINMKQFIYFTSPTCGPCRMLGPIMDELNKDFNVRKINVKDDFGAQLAAEYGIRGVPTVVLLKNGQEIERILGAKAKQHYIDRWNSI